MKKKRLIFFFFLGLFFGEVQAQFEAQFSQYAENKAAINPGAIAENDMINGIFVVRQQWMGFKNAPRNIFAAVNTPVSIMGTDHGMGLSVLSSSAGLYVNQNGLFQYSYKAKTSGKVLGLDLSGGVLSLGLNAGFIYQAFDWSKANVVPVDNGKPIENDFHRNEAFPTDTTGFSFDMGWGVFFSNEKMYAGFSGLHMPNTGVKYEGSSKEVKLYAPRVYYLTGGCNISLSNTLYVLKPSTLIKTDFKSYQMELTGLLEYNKTIQGGLSYRFQDAFVFIVGINLLNGLYAAYSYDLPISRMILSGGSHEISLRYSFKPQFTGQSKHKVIHIL